jgi:deoxyadenosine/deoxycytidine kinase
VGKTELAQAIVARFGGQPLLEAVDARRLAAFYADPAGEAWATEIEFLRGRGERLDISAATWQDRERLVVSDFWFDQSMAFAQVWLPRRACDDFRKRFEQLRRGVVRPKLIVLLDAPVEQLRERIVARGRSYERSIPTQRLEEIRASLDVVAGWPDQGPVLRLRSGEPAAVLTEVLAAIEAMR